MRRNVHSEVHSRYKCPSHAKGKGTVRPSGRSGDRGVREPFTTWFPPVHPLQSRRTSPHGRLPGCMSAPAHLAFDGSGIDGSLFTSFTDLARDTRWLNAPLHLWTNAGLVVFAVLMALGWWRAR